jgi:hypothetical protein
VFPPIDLLESLVVSQMGLTFRLGFEVGVGMNLFRAEEATGERTRGRTFVGLSEFGWA